MYDYVRAFYEKRINRCLHWNSITMHLAAQVEGKKPTKCSTRYVLAAQC